jgi:tetratricopeptide (TPR) repeat protein
MRGVDQRNERRQNRKHGIGYLVVAIAVSVTCTYSLLAVSEKEGFSNYWQSLSAIAAESRFDRIKAAVSKQHLDSGELLDARELASLYRQQGKQEEAAKIYRLLWLAPQEPESFVKDALELASLYSDMSAFPYAIESYKKVLEFDRLRLKRGHRDIVRDLNNLGLCYRCYAVSSSETRKRQANFELAAAYLAEAAEICSGKQSLVDDQVIISTNQNVVVQDRGQLKTERPFIDE